MSPSVAASKLLLLLAAPAGTVTVWPATRSGRMTLVIRVRGSMSVDAPKTFEGFPVVVERGGAVPAQFIRAEPVLRTW